MLWKSVGKLMIWSMYLMKWKKKLLLRFKMFCYVLFYNLFLELYNFCDWIKSLYNIPLITFVTFRKINLNHEVIICKWSLYFSVSIDLSSFDMDMFFWYSNFFLKHFNKTIETDFNVGLLIFLSIVCHR